ncbi:MAG: CRISPR-associated endonuclease Cas2 [bacterium]|nr:CRISPR-associated endonuclease Cas2 [bacterium]
MYYIITYDISDDRRLNKVRKILRKYLNWVQKSVFEGSLSDSQFHKCKMELESIIDKNQDSIYFYKISYNKALSKEILGIDNLTKLLEDNFI